MTGELGVAAWQPANETEQAMAAALDADDRRGYFRLLAGADLYLPGYAESDPGPTELLTADFLGETYLLAFTSAEALTARLGELANAYRVVTYEQLRAQWPQWRLAVNPDLPLAVYTSPDAVAAAAGGALAVARESELLSAPHSLGVVAHNAVEEVLAAAVASGDPEAYLRALLAAEVTVPTRRDLTAPGAAHLVSTELFPWLPGGTAQAPSISVFTSPARFTQALPAAPSVTVAFVLVAATWPEGYTLVANPGTALQLTLPAARLRQLVPTDADQPSAAGEQ
ncbi:SseB family protein [Dactylosporangium sp. AC04546]|uniref:SseB family protein n=1 Tax=Dactylosporangium sp. AC04546 TaxID=2862460 RepID=UPI001EDE0431|nr:SseB family protein [Dactylosporangium sp. AC04546]WVK80646.1 SseB family protein [Dactylosporangium sp. AC04546]